MFLWTQDDPYLFGVIAAFYIAGVLCAAQAILCSRTPQGATAWVMSLLSFPFFSVPLFIIFGRSKFEGYNNRRRVVDMRVVDEFRRLAVFDSVESASDSIQVLHAALTPKTQPGFTRGNSIELLINGKETYEAMIKEMEKAKSTIVLQVYIFRADRIGNKVAEILMRKAREGIKVTLLNDDIGNRIPRKLRNELKEAGVMTSSFNNSKIGGKLQINFRNHRKILIVDGRVAFVGGHNIGDDYLGRWKQWGPWRDTHVRLEGPSVLAAQLAVAKDWQFVSGEQLAADWKVVPSSKDMEVMVLHTGPADEKQTCLIAHLALINSACKRLWIANPYIVPPESVRMAIIMASLRGVDVRIVVPSETDAMTVKFAGRVYQEEFLKHGIRLFRFMKGFMHQKTILVDDCFGVVGSTNLDNRSMFINFEITAISTDKEFIGDLDKMFQQDFSDSRELSPDDFRQGLLDKITSRGANLLAPIL